MFRWTWLVGALVLVLGAGAADPEPGRTDGPEGSEYGTGGYNYPGLGGQYYLEAFFGSAQVDVEVEGTDNTSKTDLMGGFNAGYQLEDWLAFQLGFGYISDQKISLYSAGMRNSYDLEPFGYFLSLDAEIYAPDQGDSQFGIVPGVGAELLLSERLRVGLSYQHDFVFSDDNIDVDRFTARLQFKF
jgi:hypothetical protein